MESTIDIQKPTKKIYKDREIWVGTFLGGPLVGGYLIAENFKAFNEKNRAKKTLVFAILATIIIFGGIFLLPDNIKIPNQIIPLIYTLIAYYLVQHFQGKNIAQHINLGGEFFSWWRTIGVGIIGTLITVALLFGFIFLADNNSTSAKTYGAMKHEIAFDSSNITSAEVDKLADGLIKTAFFDEEITKYVYVKKVNNIYELSISVVGGIENDNQALKSFTELRTDLQKLFPDNKIVFRLVVDSLDNVKVIE